MGPLEGPTLANVFLFFHEIKIILEYKPVINRRYIEDFLVLL